LAKRFTKNIIFFIYSQKMKNLNGPYTKKKY